MKERLSAKTKNNKKKSTKLVHFIKEHLLRLMETKILHLESRHINKPLIFVFFPHNYLTLDVQYGKANGQAP